MNQAMTTEIGAVTDTNNDPIFRMWKVNIPSGKRPLMHHSHFNFEIMHVNSGCGTYTTARTVYPILPGDIFVFSSNEFHSITNVGREGLQITNLHFNPQFIQSGHSDSNTKINIHFCFSHHSEFSNRIAHDDAEKLSALFQQIESELTSGNTEYILSIKSFLQLLLIYLVRDHNYLNTQTSVNHEQVRRIQRTLNYIDEHFSDNITLQELSAIANLTPTYFSRLFKQIIGLSLWNYISYKRIDKAIHLIATEGSAENMLKIAVECGFNNTANFNKTFKKITGITPREYKNGEFAEIS